MAKKKNTQQKSKKITQSKNPSFGPVSTISTAPVAIGNSIRGARPVVVQISDGIRIVGRDFGTSAQSTVAAITNWQLITGFPLTPACFPSSILRNYTQMYAKFKVNRLYVHYITASATSQTGDILFYYERDRMSPSPDFTNSSFLPFVLSDPHTVIGPQWTNHTLEVVPTDGWNSTNYGMNVDLNEDSSGSVFLYSKTSSANSPGYLIFDYDISFKELAVNPRAGVLPVARAQWNYITLQLTASATTSGTTQVNVPIAGNNPDGTATAMPNGSTAGDIFKCVALVTSSTASGVNAAWTNVTTANLLLYSAAGATSTTTVDDGFTFYATYTGTSLRCYPNLTDCYASNNALLYGVTATITYSLCCMISFVGSVNSSIQASY